MTTVGRQLVGCAALFFVAAWLQPWLIDVQTTSLVSLAKVGVAAGLSGGA